MISGSREAAVFEACGVASAVAAAIKASKNEEVRIFMCLPSPLIVSIHPPVEKLPPPAYNSLSCLSRRTAALYKEFLPVVLFRAGPLPEQRRPVMAYVIAEPCIGTQDTACVDVCPVDC